ncbi:hypothetical protein BC826DRAFT_1030564 [Russula brevipes]|nr:hypothetical protein BC826DRAFT_1030564 [Russula brevipes]
MANPSQTKPRLPESTALLLRQHSSGTVPTTPPKRHLQNRGDPLSLPRQHTTFQPPLLARHAGHKALRDRATISYLHHHHPRTGPEPKRGLRTNDTTYLHSATRFTTKPARQRDCNAGSSVQFFLPELPLHLVIPPCTSSTAPPCLLACSLALASCTRIPRRPSTPEGITKLNRRLSCW